MVQTEVDPKATQPPAGPTRRALGYLLGISAFAIILDLVTKQLAVSMLDPDKPVKLLGGALYLSLTRNAGAAFSMFRDFTFIFPIIGVAVIVWIGWMARTLRSVPWAIALGLVLGGAMGNMIDRAFRAPGMFRGHVVDFFSLFHPHGQVFAIFNVADMALTFGVILAIWLELTGRMRNGTRLSKNDTDRESAEDAG